mmetsp:Transcript_5258/g.9992  ORF Transcript_5258/g.9992 Transcript_5258/m.9992 type:complete len:227 (-) Transcript_5258:321-1001(-)
MGLQVPKCCWWIQIEVPSAQKRSIILLYNHLKVLTAITVNHPFSMPLGSLGAKPQRQPTLSFRLEYLPVPTTSGKTLFQLQKCYAQRKARQHAIKYHKPAKVKRQRSLGTGGSSTMNSFASNAISIGKEEKAAREAFNDAADKALCAGKQANIPSVKQEIDKKTARIATCCYEVQLSHPRARLHGSTAIPVGLSQAIELALNEKKWLLANRGGKVSTAQVKALAHV